MQKIFAILFLFLPLFSIRSEENFTSLSLQAEALWEAHDYAAASRIYQQLLLQSLPEWQQTRLIYDLGTTQLAQKQPIEALALFQKIHPTDLSLPSFGRNLFLNEGIAYLQYAQTLASSTDSLDQQIIFVEQSLKAFDQAYQLECQIQREEQNEGSSRGCSLSFLLDQWIKTAQLQLNALDQQRRQNWMEQANIESLATLLQNHLSKWFERFNTLQFQNQSSATRSSLLSYFQQEAESFTPLWNALQQKEFSLTQKKAFEQASDSYSHALQALNQQNLSSALDDWTQAMKALAPLLFQDNRDIQQAQLNYEVLLLENSFTISALQELLTQFQSLKVKQDQSQSLEKVKENLQASLEALQAHQPLQSRFFLIAGFSHVNSLFQTKKTTPAHILQQAIDQTNRSLQLFFISEMISKDISKPAKLGKTLKSQQHEILVRASPFISSVLDEQKSRYQNPSSSCQQSPWDQVIPLYDRGYRLAQNVEKQFDQTSFQLQNMIANQEQTIKDWQQALKLILHPPQQGSAASTPQKMTETFSLIQEMYLQDQAQPEQKIGELHSW